jgi:hypothetical protein
MAALGVGPGGEFMVSWDDYRDALVSNIYTQRFSGTGTPIGSNVRKPLDDVSGVNVDQRASTIAIDPAGNFLIAWQDYRNGVDDPDIYAQRYLSDATPSGENFRVNDDQVPSYQYTPRIATNDSGTTMIAWADNNSTVVAKWFTRNGLPIISDTITFTQDFSVAANGDNFVVAWRWRTGAAADIKAWTFDGNGTAVGSSFPVNDDVGSTFQGNPWVAADDSGHLMITYASIQNGNYDVYARLFDADGTPHGPSFKVNDDIGTQAQSLAYVAYDRNGHFIVSWLDRRSGREIYCQRYASDGNPIGSNFQISDSLSISTSPITVACDDSGKTVIAFGDSRTGQYELFAQLLDPDGNIVGQNFPVSSNSGESWPSSPSVAMRNGRIYATWSDDRVDGTTMDIWANILDWNNPVSSLERSSSLPAGFALAQNYPNPFNPATTISFTLPTMERVKIEVFNTLGQTSARLLNEVLPAGRHSVQFIAGQLPSGVYFYRMQAGTFLDVKRMLLLK